MEQIIERIDTVGEDGRHVEILRYRHTRIERTNAGRRVRIGAERLALRSGQAVQPLGTAEFILSDTGERLVRV